MSMRSAVFTKVFSLFLLCACLVMVNARHASAHALRAAEIPQGQAVVMQLLGDACGKAHTAFRTRFANTLGLAADIDHGRPAAGIEMGKLGFFR